MGTQTKILIVDDDPLVLEAFSGLLEYQGYTVLTANTGQQALRMAQEHHPDVVILDIVHPVVNGIEVCRRIKNDPTLADTFVVLISGITTSPEAVVKSLETGADEYISKPVDATEFTARIRTIVRLRHMTAALREWDQRYHGLVEILPDAVVLTDEGARIIGANSQAVALLEFASEQELLGKSIYELAREEDRERMRTEISQTFDTGRMRNAEYIFNRKTAMPFPGELSAAVTRDAAGNISGLVAVMRDNTERKMSENLRREREEFNRSISATSTDGFWIMDRQGTLLDANEAYCRIIGRPLSELVGMKVFELDAKESPAEVAEHIARIVKTGSDRFESRHRRKDGQLVDVEVRATYLSFGEGFFFVFLREITEKKRSNAIALASWN